MFLDISDLILCVCNRLQFISVLCLIKNDLNVEGKYFLYVNTEFHYKLQSVPLLMAVLYSYIKTLSSGMLNAALQLLA